MTSLDKNFLPVHVTIQLHEYIEITKECFKIKVLKVAISFKGQQSPSVHSLVPIPTLPTQYSIAARFLSPRDREPLSQIHTFNETAGHCHLIVADLIHAVLSSELN